MMRVLLTGIAWLVSTAILAPVWFYAVIVLAGPHSSMLPTMIQPAVLLLGWIVFLSSPAFVARAVWRRTS